MNARTVVVLDGEAAAALSVVRSLGAAGWRVVLGSAEPDTPAARSRHVADAFVYPTSAVDREGFVQAVLATLRKEAPALLVPVTDWSIVPVLEERERIEQVAPVALPPTDAAQISLSKVDTMSLARELGIPIPPTHVVPQGQHLNGGVKSFGLPLVIKSDRSKVWDEAGDGRHLAATYALTADAASEEVRRLGRYGDVLVQARVPGVGVGVAVLAERGRTLVRFQYRRLHEVPVSGGGSSYRISESPDPELAARVDRLVEAMGWTGVAMFEFKRGDKETWLIEVNGRFWGSLALPLTAGVDFPNWLVQMTLDGRRDFPRDYRSGVRCRRLSSEIQWFKEVVKRPAPAALATYPSAAEVALDLARAPVEAWDELTLTDPGPGLALARDLVTGELRRATLKLRRNRVARAMETVRADAAALARRLADARTLMVVCAGNIVRSAYASARLIAGLARGDGLEVLSRGLWARPGRPPHPEVVRRAEARGIDLSSHRSREMTAEEIRRADVIVVMETDQVLTLRARHGALASKAVVIGALLPDGPLDVPDPIDGSAEDFLSAFDRIDRAIDVILRARPATMAAEGCSP